VLPLPGGLRFCPAGVPALTAAPDRFLAEPRNTLFDGEAGQARRWGMTVGAASTTCMSAHAGGCGSCPVSRITGRPGPKSLLSLGVGEVVADGNDALDVLGLVDDVGAQYDAAQSSG
jgi:hypothetical protein